MNRLPQRTEFQKTWSRKIHRPIQTITQCGMKLSCTPDEGEEGSFDFWKLNDTRILRRKRSKQPWLVAINKGRQLKRWERWSNPKKEAADEIEHQERSHLVESVMKNAIADQIVADYKREIKHRIDRWGEGGPSGSFEIVLWRPQWRWNKWELRFNSMKFLTLLPEEET